MKDKKLSYEQIQKVLSRLGYTAESGPKVVVFRHPETDLPVILRQLKGYELLTPLDLLRVQNALANGGIVQKDEFDRLLQTEPLELWHAIIDAEAEYENRHGHPPQVLKLPVLQASELAKLRRDQFGPLAERVMQEGIRVFEREGLLGIPVKLIPGEGEFVFE